MTVPIAYDVTRLFFGPLSRTPRGIDRVDFALASRLFRHSAYPCVGVMPTGHGIRTFDAHAVRRGLVRLEELWAENKRLQDDSVWHRLVGDLTGRTVETNIPKGRPRITRMRQASRMLSLISATGFQLGRSARRHVPPRAVYLNVGHISLALPIALRWLDKRPDVTPVFMLHDVIPLDTPQYVSPSSARHHETMVASTARHASGLLVTTAAAQRTVTEALSRFGRSDILTLAQPLPVPPVFDTPASADNSLSGVRYFVICGAIEPRKNHALLLDVWRGLVTDLGEEAPHLIITGSPGWRCEEILRQINHNPALRRRIHVVSGLSSPALKHVLAGSLGLLMPSHAEGFGLPIIEAARLGVPVMASDIPAHREVVDGQALLLDPGDPRAWDIAIRRWTRGERPRVQPRQTQHMVDEREAYFEAIETFLQTCAAQKHAPVPAPFDALAMPPVRTSGADAVFPLPVRRQS